MCLLVKMLIYVQIFTMAYIGDIDCPQQWSDGRNKSANWMIEGKGFIRQLGKHPDC